MSGKADSFVTGLLNRMNADEEFLSWAISEANEPRPQPRAAELEAAVPEAPEIEPVPEVIDAPPAEEQPAPAVKNAGKRKRGEASPSGSSGTKTNPVHKKKPQPKPKYNGWWAEVSSMSPKYPASEFERRLHMGRPTFHCLCAELHGAMAKSDTPARAAIPVPTRVAAALMRLAHGTPYREICDRFGVGVSTAHKLVTQFCAAVRAVLRGRYLVSPSAPGREVYAARVKAQFEALTGVPGVTGAVYTTHVPIIAPQLYVSAYFNRRMAERNVRKGGASHSVAFQATVHADGAFTEVFLGSDGPEDPAGGSRSDEDVLLKSGLDNYQSPLRLLGGASYPLTDYLMVPYSAAASGARLTWAQEELNKGVEAGSKVAKDAFMKLKARWAFLRRRTEVRVPELRAIFETCCVLHNFCEAFGDELDPALAFELQDDEVLPEVPVRSAAAAKERDAIAHGLFLRRANSGGSFFY